MRIREAGPAAWYLDLADAPSPETALAIGALQRALLATAPATVRDVVPGYLNVLVEFRPGTGRGRLERWLAAATPQAEAAAQPARHTVPVRYGEGADVSELQARLGLPWERIVALHAAARYTVAFLGFTPGFPYLLGLPPELATPRRDTPVRRVPAGSVAIAGDQAGIYPGASPGGWWLLGRTDQRLFDADDWPPTAWAAGDEVAFVPEPGPDPEPTAGPAPAPPGPRPLPLGDPSADPALEVLEAWPASASIQAAPRWRVGHYGMAQAGALDPLAAELANRAAGNAADAPALELLTLPLRLRALRPLRAALAGGGHRATLAGRPLRLPAVFDWPRSAELELAPGGRGAASYLALAGGIAAQRVAGSASTDARSGLGGGRRAIAGGDLLGLGRAPSGTAAAAGAHARLRPHYPQRLELHVHPGPQFHPELFARLTGTRFRVAAADRTGVRLDGPSLPQPEADVLSEGSPWGAVQVPADGRPIVLLADRGRTGGYAKPAVVDVRELWRLAQAPVGTEVWLTPAR